MQTPRLPSVAPPSRLARFSHLAFSRFQSRLLAMMLSLIVVLQAVVFFAISNAANRNALRASEEALQLTASSLQTIMNARETNLRKYAKILSSDYAFKSLVAEGDQETILSAFSSYQKRIDADWMLLLDLDGKVIANTMQDKTASHASLLQAARQNPAGESSAILMADGLAYQVVLVPLQAPEQIAWVGIGFVLTDKLASELEKQTHTHISLSWQAARRPVQILASTLPQLARSDLLAVLPKAKPQASVLTLGKSDFVSMVLPLHQTDDGRLIAVLQRSLDEALAGYQSLRWQLLGVFLLSTLIATAVGIAIARRVTQPLARLAISAGKISSGHYELIGDMGQRDEFAQLARAFDNMVRGLIERDQVRALLGKVVSPRVAEELLSRKIELGGEEREVSLLFSDLRGFTTLSEGRAPSVILAMLNTYLSCMSDLVDQHQGVVDKYIGDAIMALYGAPVADASDPQRAVASALAMIEAMPKLNQIFAQDGWPPIKIGIGIHTGIVVAGNVGSESRLNYTVLGDNVNLASRLEGLCKKYQVEIVVSAATMQRCPDITFRELDRVRVLGKREAVSIYQAIGHSEQISAEQQAWLQQYNQALAAYRRAEFASALRGFLALPEDAVSLLYRARCAKLQKYPPASDWDAIETLDEK